MLILNMTQLWIGTDSQNIRVLNEIWPMPLNIITDNKKANTAGYIKHLIFTFKA